MSVTPSKYLYFPTKNGKWLRDSQGKPRVYKSPEMALQNLKTHEYDHIQLYSCQYVFTKEEFEIGQALDWSENE